LLHGFEAGWLDGGEGLHGPVIFAGGL